MFYFPLLAWKQKTRLQKNQEPHILVAVIANEYALPPLYFIHVSCDTTESISFICQVVVQCITKVFFP